MCTILYPSAPWDLTPGCQLVRGIKNHVRTLVEQQCGWDLAVGDIILDYLFDIDYFSWGYATLSYTNEAVLRFSNESYIMYKKNYHLWKAIEAEEDLELCSINGFGRCQCHRCIGARTINIWSQE